MLLKRLASMRLNPDEPCHCYLSEWYLESEAGLPVQVNRAWVVRAFALVVVDEAGEKFYLPSSQSTFGVQTAWRS